MNFIVNLLYTVCIYRSCWSFLFVRFSTDFFECSLLLDFFVFGNNTERYARARISDIQLPDPPYWNYNVCTWLLIYYWSNLLFHFVFCFWLIVVFFSFQIQLSIEEEEQSNDIFYCLIAFKQKVNQKENFFPSQNLFISFFLEKNVNKLKNVIVLVSQNVWSEIRMVRLVFRVLNTNSKRITN